MITLCNVTGSAHVILTTWPYTVDGGYSPWSDFGECSVTCGEGVQQHERRCDSPQPLFGGKICDELELGPSIETKACVLDSCPGEIIVLEILLIFRGEGGFMQFWGFTK